MLQIFMEQFLSLTLMGSKVVVFISSLQDDRKEEAERYHFSCWIDNDNENQMEDFFL